MLYTSQPRAGNPNDGGTDVSVPYLYPARMGGSRTAPAIPLHKARFIPLFGCYSYGCTRTGCSYDVQKVVSTGLIRGWLFAVCPGGYGAQVTVPADRPRADGWED